MFENSKDIANEFNHNFTSVSEKLKGPIYCSRHEQFNYLCKQKLSNNMSYEIPEIKEYKVLKFLKTL